MLFEPLYSRLDEAFGNETLAEFSSAAITIVAIALIAWVALLIGRKILISVAGFLTRKTKTHWDDKLLERRAFHRAAHLVPAIIMHMLAPLFLEGASADLIAVVKNAASIYMLMAGYLTFSAVLDSVRDIYQTFPSAREFPITGVIQIIKIILVLVLMILVVSMLIGKSPVIILSGFGALTAVVMLVFKDPILGFVGGIQLATNRMLARGDWIEMPKYGADGEVLEIALTTVKVQNWDKTITTIPTYSLISDSFKNWRGMSESDGRRIKRALHIDMSTVKLCSAEMLERFRKIQHISHYIDTKEKEIAAWNAGHGVDDSDIVSGRRLTNVGTFRAYVHAYLRNHPDINQNMTLIVRQLAPTANGLPIEIYAFSSNKAWADYEGIQSDIFDHLIAVVPEFDLTVFQSPSGSDVQRLTAKS